eukprot:TRINITY_DN9489_c0_g2_i1.p1 TRINITY_DN9489_c0_g2~~TRINITY_DN9489_c0_g2_i1.p1  ORF type:complete len:545 (+),score=95.74 TRINITY_DN9489_c0_g2_i1:45-1679(+)
MARFRSEADKGNVARGVGVALVIATLLALFYASYSAGDSSANHMAMLLLEKRKLKDQKEKLNECKHRQMAGMQQEAQMDANTAALKATNMKLEQQVEETMLKLESLEKKHLDCVGQADSQKETWTAADRERASRIEELRERNKHLQKTSGRLTNVKGMKFVLLDASIKKLKLENRYLREKLGMPGQEIDEDEIIAKWNHTLQSSVVASNRSEFEISLTRPPRGLNASKELTGEKVFFQSKGIDGHYVRPSWGNKTGTQPLRHGVQEKSESIISTISKQIRVIYDYALCAIGNTATFTYPTYMRPLGNKPDAKDISLIDILDTPLVEFCDDCKPQEETGEFKLACQGFSTREQYGSQLFWKMRSRIRFQERILLEADNFIADNDLGEFIAIRLNWDPSFKEDCTTLIENPPQIAYRRILKRKKVVEHTTGDLAQACFPSEELAVETINNIVAKVGSPKVYVSTAMGQEQWAALQEKISAKLFRLPESVADQEAIDIMIASQAKYFVANRFDVVSSQIVEFFYLHTPQRFQDYTMLWEGSDSISVW